MIRTIVFFVIALLFGVWAFAVEGALRPALIAASFFLSIGILNIFVERIEK